MGGRIPHGFGDGHFKKVVGEIDKGNPHGGKGRGTG